MGLPLYIAPVESDIHPRSAPKSPHAHPRSAIRRRRHDVLGVDARRRAGLAAHIAAVPAYALIEPIMSSRRTGPPAEPRESINTPSAPGNYTEFLTDAQPLGGHHARAAARRPREPPRHSSQMLDERAATVMAERWANLYTGASPDIAARVQALRTAADSDLRSARSRGGQPVYSRSRPSRTRDDNVELPPIRQDTLPLVEPHTLEPHLPMMAHRAARPTRFGTREQPQRTAVDGLGDRNRSLSPESDNPWHTIVSTLTPDPQPPSVGSSFASVAASLSTSMTQSTGTARSSATSMTGMGTMPDEVDPNCDSACENSDTDDDDEDATPAALIGFFGRSDLAEDARMDQFVRAVQTYASETGDLTRGVRSYADVIDNTADRSNQSGSSADSPSEFMGDMQRIVRRLATREDIPDEWWAEVGLSRTLSRASS